jgi:hypothetical protein
MAFRNFAFRTSALAALLLMEAACGGIVTRSDTCPGSGSSSTGGFPGDPCATAIAATSNAASEGAGSTTAGTTSRTSSVAVGTSTATVGQQYSQNAPIMSTSGGSAQVTCYGVTDGSSCQVSNINFAAGSAIRSVMCSADQGRCSCVVNSPSDPPVTSSSTFPFTSGLCPTGSFGTVAWSTALADVPAAVCSSAASTLFARCGW